MSERMRRFLRRLFDVHSPGAGGAGKCGCTACVRELRTERDRLRSMLFDRFGIFAGNASRQRIEEALRAVAHEVMPAGVSFELHLRELPPGKAVIELDVQRGGKS